MTSSFGLPPFSLASASPPYGLPLVRPGVAAMVAELAKLEPRPELSLTTNAISLADKAEALAT